MPRCLRLVGVILIGGLLLVPYGRASAQETADVVQTSVTLGSGSSGLELELAGGELMDIRLSDGLLLVNGAEVGRYTDGGELESAWRHLLRALTEEDLSGAWTEFTDRRFTGADARAAEAIRSALAPMIAGAPAVEGAVIAPNLEAGAQGAVTDAQESREEAELGGTAESVSGGLVVELTRVEGLARSLGRLGLSSELSQVLNGDFRGPIRIVIDADEYRLPEGAIVDTRLLLVETTGIVAGTVAGDVIVAEGSLRLEPTARIEGDVVAINADVNNLGGTIVGHLREAPLSSPVVVDAVPLRVRVRGEPSLWDNASRGVGGLAQTFAMYLLFGFLGALAVYFFRGHLETVSDTVSYSFGRSFLAGLAAEVLFFPILLVLTVLVLTIIAIPFYVVAFVMAALLGYMAVAHAAGENLTRYRYPSWAARMRRANSYYYVLNGLGVLMALFAAAAISHIVSPVLGWAHDLLIASAWILTWVAATSGLGAALLSRGGTQRKYARPRQLPELPVEGIGEQPGTGRRRARAGRGGGGIDEI